MIEKLDGNRGAFYLSPLLFLFPTSEIREVVFEVWELPFKYLLLVADCLHTLFNKREQGPKDVGKSYVLISKIHI